MEWGQTSCLMALVANIMRDPKKGKTFKPEDFNPYHEKDKKVPMAPLNILKDVFVKDKK